MVLHNPNSVAASAAFNFSSVPHRGWDDTTKLLVRDAWAKADLGVATGGFATRAPLPPHGSVFLKLLPPPLPAAANIVAAA